MFESLDAIIATAAVVLGLSLIVDALQQIAKHWLDLKSQYMRLQLLGIFDQSQGSKETVMAGLKPVTWLAKGADEAAQAVVLQIERTLKSFGYKDLELLEGMDAAKLKHIVSTIDWSRVQGVQPIVRSLNAELDLWFDVAKRAYQDLYERRMKLWSFLLSAAVVVALDANLFKVYNAFSVRPELKAAAVAWAGRELASETERAHGSPRMQPDTLGIDSVAMSDSKRVQLIRARIDSIHSILSADAFQVLGWKSRPYESIWQPGWVSNWTFGLIGWFGMALLVSLGAPFWYDLLKTLMGIKNSLKNGKAKSGSSRSSG